MASYAAAHRQRAEALRAPKGRRPGSAAAAAALGSVVAREPSTFDGRKIAAVDRGIATLDALPERYASIKTLYISKNSLRSLAGIEQFAGLKALSAADNLIADLDELRRLPAAGIALEAASFEGCPIAALPNYRAHVIHTLGPQLSLLDNRAVGPEERAAAPGAVAHEATLLALMVANACLVHKLGRSVQLVKLHAELQCAVLGGGRGGGSAAGADGALCAGRGIGRVLQWWDYEGALGRQERHAIGLAIRREVGRRHRAIVLGGGRPEGSSKLWQQAFAQVMLQQQETIASLMQLLEEAKAEAAAVLAPLTRPPSPAKRRALEGEAQAAERVRHDREALICELRDAFLSLAGTTPAQGGALPQWEARIRELHAALEAAGDAGLASGAAASVAQAQQAQQRQQQATSPSKAPAGVGVELAAGQWAIPAARPVVAAVSVADSPAEVTRPASATTPRQLGIGRLKSALKPVRPSSTGSGWSPAKPSAQAATPRGGMRGGSSPDPLPRPPPSAVAQPGSVRLRQQQQQQQEAPACQRHEQDWSWQADDGLAEYEQQQAEEARCKTPRPFRLQAASQPVQPWASTCGGTGTDVLLAAGERSSHQLPPPAQHAAAATMLAQQQQQPLLECSIAAAAPAPVSLPGSQSSSPPRSRPGSPSQWTANPLARQSTAGGGGSRPASQPASRPASPGSPGGRQGGLQGVFRLLEREGRLNQVEALRGAIAAYETTAAELQASNLELSEALQAAQQRARSSEERLTEQQAAAEAAAEAAAAEQQGRAQQLEELGARLEELLASRADLQAQLQAATGERQQLAAAAAAEREATAAAAQQLQARIAELEQRPPVHLSLCVSHEAEWRAEAVRAAALEARAGELQAALAAHQRQARLEAACARLAQRAVIRRALLWWRDAAAERACMGALRQAADAHRRTALLTCWLAKWRLAAQRSKLLASREAGRQHRRLALAWDAWRLFLQDRLLRRGLDAAACMHRQSVLVGQAFDAWRHRAAACRQVELPLEHPLMRAAAELQRRRLVRGCFGAWRLHMQENVLPRMAAVQVRLLEQCMGTQRRALVAWQQYLAHRRECHLHKDLARQHWLRQLLSRWRQAAADAKEEHTALLRGALTSTTLLLRRGWRAWRAAMEEERREAVGLALAESHHRAKLLAKCWQGWGQWTALCRGMRERHAARLLAAALQAWRAAVKWAEKRRAAEALYQRACQRRFRATLRAWREAAAARRRRRAQLAHVSALLRRRALGRALAGWRRAALAGRLCASLAVVHELQGAVERVSEELQAKARQIDTLQSVRVTVEGNSEQLSLQVSHLDADLAEAREQAAALQAAAQQAQQELQQALADKAAAQAAAAAAEAAAAAAAAEREAATAGKERAEAERDAACAARAAAEQQAAGAGTRSEAAATAAAEAMARAAAATAALDSLVAEHAALQEQLTAVQQERQALAADLEQALAEAAEAARRLERLTEERDRARRQREAAQQAATAAEAEQQAALRQAERLTRLCEQERESCRALQQRVAELQGMLGSQGALQEELARLADRNQALQASNADLAAQLERFAAAVQQAEGDKEGLQAAAQALQAEQRELAERGEAAAAEAAHLSRLAEALRGSKAALEQRLAEAQAAAAEAEAERQRLAAAVEALRGERDGLAATARQLQEEKGGLEGAVGRLRDQLQASNGVLDSCRQLLGECCSARSAAADEALSLQEMLRSVKAELLLKDAAIRALNRENAQRAERLRALQQQVDCLSQQVAVGQQGPGPCPTPSAGQCTGQAAAALSYAQQQQRWAATPVAASGASATGSLASGGRSSLGAAGAALGSPVAGLFASPAPSFLPLSASQQRSAGSAAASPPGSSGLAPAAGSPAASGASAVAAGATPQLQLLGRLSPASPSVAAAAGEELPLSDQRLSYLLELVVQKQLSAAQAQQVINSAAEGDARPLLQVLESVKRRMDGRAGGGAASPVPGAHQQLILDS